VVARMTFRVEVVCLPEGGEQRCSVAELDRAELVLETLGISVAEGKSTLHGIQEFMAVQQVIEDLRRKRVCPACGRRFHSKDAGTHTIKTVFGEVEVPNPRWGVVHAKPKVHGHSGRPRPGYKRRAPVRSCCIWRRSGPRWFRLRRRWTC
jgi:hypothetical protein